MQHHSTCPCGSTLWHVRNTTWCALVALPLHVASSQLPKPQVAVRWLAPALLQSLAGASTSQAVTTGVHAGEEADSRGGATCVLPGRHVCPPPPLCPTLHSCPHPCPSHRAFHVLHYNTLNR